MIALFFFRCHSVVRFTHIDTLLYFIASGQSRERRWFAAGNVIISLQVANGVRLCFLTGERVHSPG